MKIKNMGIGLFILLAFFAFNTDVIEARGGSGGGRGGGARSSGSSFRSSSVKSSSFKSTSSVSSKPSTPKISKSPSKSTAKVVSSSPKTVNGKSYGKTGSVVDATYQPKFNGYSAPVGSTVYYRESSAMDWLPFYLILSSQNAHREAVVVEPAKDGQAPVEKVVKEEGLDTMYVVNWIVSILLVIGLIWLIVYFVNRKTNNNYYA